ncbi:uncharacterized protein ACIBXB_006217 isoform 3-T5 [Morphnus guianensis]
MWRTAKRREFQKRKGGEKEKEASELARSPGSSKSESCAGCQLAPFCRGCSFFCHDGTRQMERFCSGLQVQVCHFDFSWKEIFQNGSLSYSKKFCFMNFPSEWIFRGDRLDSRSHQ